MGLRWSPWLPIFVLGTVLAAPLAPGLGPSITREAAAAESNAADTDFLFRLAMMEGHLIVGHELLAAGKPELAMPHFGHPVSELYDDLKDYLNAKSFPAFDAQLIKLEAAVATAPSSPETEKQYQAVMATLGRARDLPPRNCALRSRRCSRFAPIRSTPLRANTRRRSMAARSTASSSITTAGAI